MSLKSSLLIITLLLAVGQNCAAQSTMQPWLTRSFDNSRSGWNPRETQLTQASVQTKGIFRATIIPLVGDARGMEAQPLVLPNVKTDLGTHDVMVLPSTVCEVVPSAERPPPYAVGRCSRMASSRRRKKQ